MTHNFIANALADWLVRLREMWAGALSTAIVQALFFLAFFASGVVIERHLVQGKVTHAETCEEVAAVETSSSPSTSGGLSEPQRFLLELEERIRLNCDRLEDLGREGKEIEVLMHLTGKGTHEVRSLERDWLEVRQQKLLKIIEDSSEEQSRLLSAHSEVSSFISLQKIADIQGYELPADAFDLVYFKGCAFPAPPQSFPEIDWSSEP